MSGIATIEAGFATRYAAAKRTAERHIERYLKQGGIRHAIAFEAAAEEQQIAAHKLDAAGKLARAWRK